MDHEADRLRSRQGLLEVQQHNPGLRPLLSSVAVQGRSLLHFNIS